jgi:hypothetical protein
MVTAHSKMFCSVCGTKLINSDCNSCFSNSNALKEFEDEDD